MESFNFETWLLNKANKKYFNVYLKTNPDLAVCVDAQIVEIIEMPNKEYLLGFQDTGVVLENKVFIRKPCDLIQYYKFEEIYLTDVTKVMED